MPLLAAMRSRSPVRRRGRRAPVARPGPDSIARRRGGAEGAVPPLGMGGQAVELAPSHAGLAGRDHQRLLSPPALPTCACPLPRSPSGASDGPEVSLRTSRDWGKDAVPRTAAHSVPASGSSLEERPWLGLGPSLNGTRFRYRETFGMNLSVASGMHQDAVLSPVCAPHRFVHDGVVVPPCVEFSTSMPRTPRRPGYGDGFLGAPLHPVVPPAKPAPREEGGRRGTSRPQTQQIPGSAPHV